MKIQEILSLLEKNKILKEAIEQNINKIKSFLIKNSDFLEDENFRVNSEGWEQTTNKQGITYLENPEWDIREFVAGVPIKFIGEQFFRWGAVMRETKKVGKKIPTNEEWGYLKQNINNVLYSGYCSANGFFYNITSIGFFWSSTVSGHSAWLCSLSLEQNFLRFKNHQSNMFSVRCLKS